MLFSDSYRTVKAPAEGAYRDRGSKFIAYLFPVQKEEEIKEHLHALKKEHPSARHFCYAWRLGAAGDAYRANDDGEPSGSAGKPILGQLLSNDLTNCLVIVVRYFGGTLLGVSGLINAYREAAADAIKNSDIEEKFILFEYSIGFPNEDTGIVMHLLKELDAKITRTEYQEENLIVFRIRKSYSDRLEEHRKTLYRCQIKYLSTL